MHAETLRECGSVKLPFAGYSVRSLKKEPTLNASAYEIVWDDRRSALRVACELRCTSADPRQNSLPVVIGSGFHPFPFRTRKLSLIPPMVLCGKLHGRVGRCRHYYQSPL